MGNYVKGRSLWASIVSGLECDAGNYDQWRCVDEVAEDYLVFYLCLKNSRHVRA